MQNCVPAEKAEASAALQLPAVVMEILKARRISGKTLIQYDSGWTTLSVVAQRGAIVKLHMSVVEGLFCMITLDQLDPARPYSAEYLTRWVVIIEPVTQKSPKQLECDGLDVMVSGRLKETGGFPGFTARLMGIQRDVVPTCEPGFLLAGRWGAKDAGPCVSLESPSMARGSLERVCRTIRASKSGTLISARARPRARRWDHSRLWSGWGRVRRTGEAPAPPAGAPRASAVASRAGGWSAFVASCPPHARLGMPRGPPPFSERWWRLFGSVARDDVDHTH